MESPQEAQTFLLARLAEKGMRGWRARGLLRQLRDATPVSGAQHLQQYGLGYREAFDALRVLRSGTPPPDQLDPHRNLSAGTCVAIGLGCIALGLGLSWWSHQDAVAAHRDSFLFFRGLLIVGGLFLLRAMVKWVIS